MDTRTCATCPGVFPEAEFRTAGGGWTPYCGACKEAVRLAREAEKAARRETTALTVAEARAAARRLKAAELEEARLRKIQERTARKKPVVFEPAEKVVPPREVPPRVLRVFSDRPGAADAFALPSLTLSTRVFPVAP